MALEIRASTARDLPSSVTNALGKMDPAQQAVFEEEYLRRRRNPILLQLLAILFPIQFFLEGRIWQGILFWVTIGGYGVWWIIEIVIVWGRTRRFNEETAKSLLRDMRIMGS